MIQTVKALAFGHITQEYLVTSLIMSELSLRKERFLWYAWRKRSADVCAENDRQSKDEHFKKSLD